MIICNDQVYQVLKQANNQQKKRNFKKTFNFHVDLLLMSFSKSVIGTCHTHVAFYAWNFFKPCFINIKFNQICHFNLLGQNAYTCNHGMWRKMSRITEIIKFIYGVSNTSATAKRLGTNYAYKNNPLVVGND